MMSSSPWEIETVNTVVCIRGVSGEMKIHNEPNAGLVCSPLIMEAYHSDDNSEPREHLQKL